MDKEYILLSEIEKNGNITQRELSKKTELSLGSVNILLNKMVHEGLIKIKQIPMNRVAYMLTPVGIAEKVKKTSNYIKIHYNYINETTKKIIVVILRLIEERKDIGIILENDEISELVKLAISEIDDKQHIEIIGHENVGIISIKETKSIVAISMERYNELSSKGISVINLLELL